MAESQFSTHTHALYGRLKHTHTHTHTHTWGLTQSVHHCDHEGVVLEATLDVEAICLDKAKAETQHTQAAFVAHAQFRHSPRSLCVYVCVERMCHPMALQSIQTGDSPEPGSRLSVCVCVCVHSLSEMSRRAYRWGDEQNKSLALPAFTATQHSAAHTANPEKH